MLHATFLAANQAWTVTNDLGDIVPVGPAAQTLFGSRKELLRVLKQCGLTLKGNLVEMAQQG